MANNTDSDSELSGEEKRSRSSKISHGHTYARTCKALKDWFTKIDSNEDRVSMYLRPVSGDANRVFCAADNTYLKVGSRGFAAVRK